MLWKVRSSFSLHGHGSWTRTRVIAANCPSRAYVSALREVSVDRSAFLDQFSGLDFPSGTRFTLGNFAFHSFSIERAARVCVCSEQCTLAADQPEGARHREVRQLARKSSLASRITLCICQGYVLSNEASVYAAKGNTQKTRCRGRIRPPDHIQVSPLQMAPLRCI